MQRLKVEYLNTNYEVHFHEYIDGKVAVYLHGTDSDDDFMPATTNVSFQEIPDNAIVVDHWEGLAFALFKGGVIDEPLFTVVSGFNSYGVFKLTNKAVEQMRKELEENVR